MPADFYFFRECVAAACAHHDCALHAYVLMPNHVHLLLTPERSGAIGDVMKLVGGRYVPYFNRTYARTGTLWEGRYRATVVDAEHHLLACYRYIDLNPVRARIVAHPGDYAWSSYATNALGAVDALVTPHERYLALGMDERARRDAYRALVNSGMSDAMGTSIRQATRWSHALGGPTFRETIGPISVRRPQPLPSEDLQL